MTETTAPTPPNDRRTFVVNKEDLKVFMSFQRLNSLLRVLEDANNLPLITVDPDLSEACMRVLLSPTQAGQFDIKIDEYEIESDVADEMILWCQDHLTSFFIKRLQQMDKQNGQLGPMVKDLQSSLLGSPNSTSAPASAGPSELTPAV